MKKIFTLALLVITYAVYAHPNDGKMSVTNLSQQRIIVELDGKRFEERADNYNNLLLIPEVSSGYHSIKVYLQDDSKGATKMGLRKQVLVFQKNLNVRPQFHIDIVVNRFGKVWYDELSMKDPKYVDTDADDWNNSRDNGYNPGGNQQPGSNQPGGGYQQPGRGNNPNIPSGNGYPGGYNNGYRPMNDQSFAALKETLTRERFDNSRVTIAKQVIDQNLFTVDQVKQLVQMYSFDNYKLDLAKYAYKNTLNKQDYFMLYDVFQFSSSKEELAAFIRNYK